MVDYGTLVSAILIVFVFSSILWKDNLLFRFAEHTLLALALGILVNGAIVTIMTKGVEPVFSGTYLNIVPLIAGLLLFTRTSKTYGWISRTPMALLMGIGLGLGVRGAAEVGLMGQVQATILPLIGGKITPIDNIVLIVGTVSSLSYFLFTIGIKGPSSNILSKVQKIGRYTMMVAFGGVFGNTIMSRMIWIASNVNTVLKALGIAT